MKRRHLLTLSAAAATLGLPQGSAQAVAPPSKDIVLLAMDYTPGLNLAQYWVSEKLDGVRALWDGAVLRHRSGRVIAAPAWFTAKLPATPLDGELWFGRGQFDALSGAVRRKVPDAQWERVQYHVFELPPLSSSAPSAPPSTPPTTPPSTLLSTPPTTPPGMPPTTFTQRIAAIQTTVAAANWPALVAVPQFRVANEAALQARLAQVVQGGGEGLMLHQADAPYLVGRQAALRKLKAVADAEAVVLAHVSGKGKHAGMVGALEVRTQDGHRLRVGTGLSDAQRQNPPPVGSTITYSYRDKTPSGKPRFASFLRIADVP